MSRQNDERTPGEIAGQIIQAVCELDRNSPEDDPDLMLVYPHELQEIVISTLLDDAS